MVDRQCQRFKVSPTGGCWVAGHVQGPSWAGWTPGWQLQPPELLPEPAAVLALQKQSAEVIGQPRRSSTSDQQERRERREERREGKERRKERREGRKEGSLRADWWPFIVKGCSCGNVIFKAANPDETTVPHFCCLFSPQGPKKETFFENEPFLPLMSLCLKAFTHEAFKEF